MINIKLAREREREREERETFTILLIYGKIMFMIIAFNNYDNK